MVDVTLQVQLRMLAAVQVWITWCGSQLSVLGITPHSAGTVLRVRSAAMPERAFKQFRQCITAG